MRGARTGGLLDSLEGLRQLGDALLPGILGHQGKGGPGLGLGRHGLALDDGLRARLLLLQLLGPLRLLQGSGITV